MKTKITAFLLLLFFAISCKKDKNDPDINKGLISYFNFDDNLIDQQGYSHVTALNDCSFVTGKIGKASHFNGIDQLVQFVPNTPQTQESFTAAAWFKSEQVANPDAIIFVQGAGIYIKIGFQSGKLVFLNKLGNTPVTLEAPYLLNEWVHIIVTYEQSKFNLYVNGNLFGSINSSVPFYGFRDNLNLGHNSTSYLGSIDELYIYNRAITQAEVTQLYNLK